MTSRRSTSLLEPPRSLYTIKEDEELQIPPVRKIISTSVDGLWTDGLTVKSTLEQGKIMYFLNGD